jgi:tetratricopeptide (TPR) repeat protein
MAEDGRDKTDQLALHNFKTGRLLRKIGEFLLGAAAWAWLRSNVPQILKRVAAYIFQNFYSFLLKLPWVVAILIVAAIVIHGLTEHATVIQPLSVPETLAKSGYTPEVAANRMRDALQEFVKSADTHMKSPDIALHGELPDIVVPSVGISLDAIMSTIRTLLRSTRSRTVSGEIINVGDQLWLRVRLDGRQIYASDAGVDPKNPDQLLKLAAPAILKEIKPYIVAAGLSDSSPDDALVMTDAILTQVPETDENAVWSHVLRGNIFTQRKEYSAAIDELNLAIQLDGTLAAPHVNLAVVFVDQGFPQKGIDEYHKALALDPKFSIAHSYLGSVLHDIHKDDEAMAEFKEAIKDDPNSAFPYIGIGIILSAAGKDEEAIAEYRKAIKIDPRSDDAHDNLGNALRATGHADEAIAEYRIAITINPKDALFHDNLGLALKAVGKRQDAIAEFQLAVALDPNNGTARAQLQQLGH